MLVLQMCFVVCLIPYVKASGAEQNGRDMKSCFECLNKQIPEDRCATVKCECNIQRGSRYNGSPLLRGSSPRLVPKVYCKSQTMIVLVWETEHSTKNMYYYIEYTNRFLERRRKTNLTTCNYAVVQNLAPGAQYKFTLNKITVNDENASIESGTPVPYTTLRPDKEPDPVNKLFLKSLTFSENRYTAELGWKKGNDKACYYDIVAFQEEYITMEIRNPLDNERANITDLELGKRYTIMIRPLSDVEGDRPEDEGAMTSLNITVPTCLETFRTTSKCVPEKPQNLTVIDSLVDFNGQENVTRHNIILQWSKPVYQPDYYEIRLRFADLPSYSTVLNVTGNSTNATIEDVAVTFAEFRVHYLVAVVAVSDAGRSAMAIVDRHFNVSFIPIVDDKASWNGVEVIMMIAGPLIAIGLLAVFSVNWYFVKVAKAKKMKYFKELHEKIPPCVLTTLHSLSNSAPDHWEISHNQLIIKSLIGEGAFGLVKKGFYINKDEEKVEVAIKMLKDHPTVDELKQFYQEIDIMKSVPKHPHLVSMLGCVTRGISPLLVVEYCSKGDLQSYLRSSWDKLMKIKKGELLLTSPNPEYVSNVLYDFSQVDIQDILQPKDLLSFARQIIIGMEHLASLKLIHRDLAARNVLVCENNTVKISDFGLSRDVYYDNIYRKLTGGKVPIRWMALECMIHQVYTTQSDIWSFGVLLWEIVTMGSSTPYPGIQTQDILPMLKSGYRMEKPPNCGDELYAIMCNCWKTSPQDRPTFSELRTTFDGLLEKVSCYLNLDLEDRQSESNRYSNLFSERYVEQVKILDL